MQDPGILPLPLRAEVTGMLLCPPGTTPFTNQAGLKLTEIGLPLPPECATTAWQVLLLKSSIFHFACVSSFLVFPPSFWDHFSLS